MYYSAGYFSQGLLNGDPPGEDPQVKGRAFCVPVRQFQPGHPRNGKDDRALWLPGKTLQGKRPARHPRDRALPARTTVKTPALKEPGEVPHPARDQGYVDRGDRRRKPKAPDPPAG